ncbi:ATP-binding protein [Hymenobacter sp. 5516J-16]|uniref:ATP-binding protein n=1 Tax=Hymenobacter sp. 5516J-16 TaxID=2932253 RepID=UPI001FD0E7FE|nr:ATP-binding protein [Hymenobacter sp. 5516J-16]UOQ77858.1 ATP-binding protein [Hymenobacter sp. 5516J-16]
MKWIITVLLLLVGRPMVAQHGYWAADFDSLNHVLRRQQADTARVRTLTHMLDVVELTEVRRRVQVLPLLDELFRLNARTQQLDEAPYRELRAGVNFWVKTRQPRQALDALHQAIELFDEARHPIPLLLIDLGPLYNELRESDARFAYLSRKLTQYRVQGAIENQAACYLVLGGTFRHRGDYNQAISYYLHAADLFQGFHRRLYTNELMVAGTTYAEWGNAQKALQYLKQASELNRKYRIKGLQRLFGLQAVTKLYLQQGNLAAALRYANQTLETARLDSVDKLPFTAYGLVLKSQVLLAQHQPQQVGPLLARAQQIADSLRMPITGRPGEFALDATWAQYYTARQDYPRADAAWQRAYEKATAANFQMLRPKYLKQIIRFQDARGAAEPLRRYTRIYLDLMDTLNAAQGNNLLAQYEGERIEQAQNNQIIRLRHEKSLQGLRLRQRNQLLGVAAVAILLISGLGLAVYRQLYLNKQTLVQLRATQHQLVQSEKWAFVGEVSAGIAHELQNPLNFMKRFAEVSTTMVDTMHEVGSKPGLEQKILLGLRQNLQEISQHGIRASAIIKDMLEHSRAGTGQREPTDLNALLLEYLQLARQSPELRDQALTVGVETDLAPNLPSLAMVPSDMGRVLLNLFTNALYAVAQRQQTGETNYQPLVKIGTQAGPNGVEIWVQDNGAGMSPEVLANIFQPFFTTKPAGEGTGLGLSLSYDIVKSHGGTIRAESEEGRGSRFVVTLPGA